MKINEIIRERRLASGLTQEQVAKYLGVTTPAVNKWEKGVSYPDITLLPALARVLNTDLNTLLSFQDDLSEREIALFLNGLSRLLDTSGFNAVYQAAEHKIREFPTCYPLILNTALFLDGALSMSPKTEHREEYETQIEGLYHLALKSQDAKIQNQAKSILISRLMKRKSYKEAQSLLDSLPERDPVDKRQIQANLYLELGQLEEAAKIEEEKLLSATNELHQILMTLMEIALKDDRLQDAEYIANVSKDGAKLFDLWEYSSYVAHFQLYSACKKPMKCLKVLIPMLRSITQKWEFNRSPLYRHIPTKDVDQAFSPRLQKNLVDSIRTDQDTAFLNQEPEFQALLKELNLDSDL